MDHFWTNVFEYFKDRHLGAVFIRTLLVLILLLVAGIFLYPFWAYIWPVMAGIFLFWMGRAFLQARARWRNRYQSSPLSRDEIIKARAKLIRARP